MWSTLLSDANDADRPVRRQPVRDGVRTQEMEFIPINEWMFKEPEYTILKDVRIIDEVVVCRIVHH